ncbi:chemotaxis protein CheB [Magnetococcales bacterium HHB-1]
MSESMLISQSHVTHQAVTSLLKMEISTLNITSVWSGAEALVHVLDHVPDLVLLDVATTDISPDTITRRIKAFRQETKILLLHDASNADFAQTMRHSGANGCASIPAYYMPEELRDPSCTHTRRLANVHFLQHISILTGTTRFATSPLPSLSQQSSASQQSSTRTYPQTPPHALSKTVMPRPSPPLKEGRPPPLIGIGSSSGGPSTLAVFLSNLRRPLDIPIVICQHFTPQFSDGFVQWLQEETQHPTLLVKRSVTPQPGMIYIAPCDANLRLSLKGSLYITPATPEQTQLPDINLFFTDMARVLGVHACGIILTGMGDDGADGIKAIHQVKGQTFIQSPQSAIYESMPRAALSRGITGPGLPPVQIAHCLNFWSRTMVHNTKPPQ